MHRDERGSLSVWIAVSLVAFVVLVGLGVDLAGHAGAEQEARAVAAEAARTGAQRLVMGPDGRLVLDSRVALDAAEGYVAASRFAGAARLRGGEIEVTVTGTHPTLFLGIIGVEGLNVGGTARARAVTVIDGAEG